jgi:Zn-dependent protease with chaperone function
MTKMDIKVTSAFKTQTTKAIVSIILFIVAYFIMFALAVGLTILCIYGGIMIIAVRPMIISFALGIGLGSLGVFVLIFLLKFIFKSHKTDRSHLVEIKKEDEPKLFKLIEEIVKKVDTDFPKKVYLSSDVNASVFYDSSFWSMFLPIKKNLQIGLGLVNTVSKSELTAILSHEFGHFSQKSMKVGSYVYNVNQVIFNLLFDNESYDTLIQRWANASGYFSIFVLIAVKIIDGVKWVSGKMYGLVNKSYLGLSREMEFHADEIAANVTGYESLKSALLKLTFADHSFNSTLSFYQIKINENLKTENVFRDHLYVTHFLAQENNIKIENDLPQIYESELNKYNKSKLVVKDQWASHPSIEDRIAKLEKTGLLSNRIDDESANALFMDIESTQKDLTSRMFKNVIFTGECSTISFDLFQTDFIKEYINNGFPKIYNSYYDNKNPLFFDIQGVQEYAGAVKLEELYSDDMVEVVYVALAIKNDMELIKQISTKTIDVETFDYDGIKYTKNSCEKLLKKLELEHKQLSEEITQNDIKIYQFFSGIERTLNKPPLLEDYYFQFFKYDAEFESKFDTYVKLTNALQFVNHQTPFEQIGMNFKDIVPLEEDLKNGIRELLVNPDYDTEWTNEIKENFELYLSKKWKYFGNDAYIDTNLQMLFSAMNNYSFLISRGYFLMKKKLLNYQEELFQGVK